MDSVLVIKVKYRDILRRFNVRVDKNKQLDLDLSGLRAKILSLFNFPADANLMLRYVDEDGDLVTLVDDDDLHDVMRQRLKFLRIDVCISNDNGSKPNARSRGNAIPLRSPPFPNPCMSGNAAVSDVSKTVPETLHKTFSNLSLDLAAKAASSSPVVATLTDPISKMGQSLLNSDGQPRVAIGRSSKIGASEDPIAPETRVPQATCVDLTSNANQQVEAGKVTRVVPEPVAPVDLNILPCLPNPSQFANWNTAPDSSAVPDGDGKEGEMATNDKGDSCGVSTSCVASDNSSTETTARGSSPFVEQPHVRYFFESEAPSLGNPWIHPFKRNHSHIEAMGGLFHKGVRCNGCGVYPITGPCFKSKLKQDYNLCNICFYGLGNEPDYIRMDRPMCDRSPQSFKGLYEHPLWMCSPTLPHMFQTGPNSKHAEPKLDSRFILDVNVVDGTMMAPSTAFTKIWRMHNDGTTVWPKGTQFVWIGGDKFSDSHSVNLEIPVEGVPVDMEFDIAVEFRAPQFPGRYISYWRMASPSGQKFGQRVWVLIQVDASMKETFYDSSQHLNLNIPLDGSGSKWSEVVDFNVQPIVDDVFLQRCNFNASTKPRQEIENSFPINETTFVCHAASAAETSVAPPSVSYPIIDFPKTAPAVPFNPQVSAVDTPLLSPGTDGNTLVEETLLKELEEMGFMQFDLNKEILRMNEYNMEQSVDELCGVSEWEPMLKELQQMGFTDNELNKSLLMKNNGSINHVVMELICQWKD